MTAKKVSSGVRRCDEGESEATEIEDRDGQQAMSEAADGDGEESKKENDEDNNAHRLRSAPCKADVQRQAAPSFTVETGHLHGYMYEGGGSGQSHPENADPDQRVDKHGWS